MSTPPTIRLTLFFAWERPLVVILRQGPHRLARLILWDRRRDRFEDGQWLKARVYAERCAVSADGGHFLYFALDGRWTGPVGGTYTAISRPPYFTALALFPQGDTWGGGGRFLDARRFWLATGRDTPDLVGRAGRLERVERLPPGPEGLARFRHADGRPVRLDKDAHRIAQAGRFVPEGAGVTTEGGRLYRRGRLVRDFTDMAFAEIRAPYDRRGTATARPRDTRDSGGRGR